MSFSRFFCAAVVVCAACYPKQPAPDVQCHTDADCFNGGFASTVTVTAEDGSAPDVQADGVTPIIVKLTLIDAHGNPVPGVPVFIDVGASVVVTGPAATGDDGKFQAKLTSHVQGTRT